MQALAEHLPAVAQRQVGKGGFLVLRPDSGDCSLPCKGLAPALHLSLHRFLCVHAQLSMFTPPCSTHLLWHMLHTVRRLAGGAV